MIIMENNKGRFTRWFEEQFGERPSDRPLYELGIDVSRSNNAFIQSQELYRKTLEWDTRFEAALKGYSAKDYIEKME